MSEVVFTNTKCTNPKELANALLGNILWGEFPDEEISQAELTSAEIPVIVDGLEKAIGEVKVCTHMPSRDAGDLDLEERD